ncbi:hypothetical protein CDL15_Pgr013365 [Punica granatum]|uniref:Uncharacterized protein n=1 Tax=Punica granatum TaxID=22663 RepID=A0A218W100_PUNGR|nr:hypothetical protein CDL15_Pgr013365 [Punica granatum]PKI31772.1 hypothetical protein CRG98_047839 [Punica granatum]
MAVLIGSTEVVAALLLLLFAPDSLKTMYRDVPPWSSLPLPAAIMPPLLLPHIFYGEGVQYSSPLSAERAVFPNQPTQARHPRPDPNCHSTPDLTAICSYSREFGSLIW